MLDLIVPVYRSAELTGRCLDSIVRNLPEIADRAPRLIVINDSPDDEPATALLAAFASEHPGHVVLANETNQGFVKTANRGLELARKAGHDAILINADTETFPGTLAELLAVVDRDPLIGFASPRSNNASICSLPHVHGGLLPSPEQAYQRWAAIAQWLPRLHFVPTAVGFYLFIKHRVLADIGLLSEAFGVGYEEENELILRANRVGYRAVLANRAFAYHAGSASFNLVDLSLDAHRVDNLDLIKDRHPEFMELIQRYEASPHFRTEYQISALAPPPSGRMGLCIDLSEMGTHHNGTNEMALSIVNALYDMPDNPFDVALACSQEAFRFHRLRSRPGFVRVDPANPGRHAIALRLGQPFDRHHVNRLEMLAPVNVYGMLDTIAADVGVLSLEHDLITLWEHIARHANGFFFISEFARQAFLNRYPAARGKPGYARLLPTRLALYRKPADPRTAQERRQHILVLGNHFPHKASDAMAEPIRRAFPTLQVVVLGAHTFAAQNVQGWRSGTLAQDTVDELFARASVVVLPSYIEGFGFGLLHALAAGKPVVARNIEATREILATFDRVEGVHLFDDNTGLVEALTAALRHERSQVDDSRAIDWRVWTNGLVAFCQELLASPEVFTIHQERIREGDLIRKAAAAVQPVASRQRAVADLPRLLRYEDEEFVHQAYREILQRPADPEGLAVYLGQVQRGRPRLLIVLTLRYSAEGRDKRTPLKGWFSALWQRAAWRR